MDILYPNLFHALFETDVPRLILRAGSLELEILKYNQSFKEAKSLGNVSLIGKNLWDVYEFLDHDKERKELLKDGIQKAIKTRASLKLAPFSKKDADEKENWWQIEIIPITNQEGVVCYILISVLDVTKAIIGKQKIKQNKKREHELNEELATTNEDLVVSNQELAIANKELFTAIDNLNNAQKELKLLNDNLEEKVKERLEDLTESENNMRNLVMNAHYPLMILKGKNGMIEIANKPALRLLGKSFKDIKRKSLTDVLPVEGGAPFIQSLKHVYASGQRYGKEEQAFHYQSFRGPSIKYINYYYDPLFDTKGTMIGIIVSANDVTNEVKSRKALEKMYIEQIELNDEIAAINEELEATVDELSSSNDNLSKSQKELELKNLELSEGEKRFRNLIAQAPVGICVVKAHNLLVEEVNSDFLTLSGRSREELENHNLWAAIPESAEQYAPIMNEVIATGIAYKAVDREVLLIRNGKEENIFVDFVFEPIKNTAEKVTSVMIVAIEITDKVLARRKIEDVEERIRLAVEAAEMGTYDYNLSENKILTTPRLDRIFGLEEVSSREDLLAMLHPEDLKIMEEAHHLSKLDGKLFYEARLIHKDKSIHWIRVQGNVYFNEKGDPERLLGTVLDITEYKFLLQQKDDFISIASHELKTPITGLKASFQLLQRMKDNLSGSLAPRLIEQANRSMKRISELVEDLLDVGKISEGSLKINKSNFCVNDLINDCCQHIRAEGKYQLILTAEKLYNVYADEHRIEQVIINLINNAVKYAPDSNDILINVDLIDSFIRVSVKDNGPGVLPEKLPYLFERYYRADSSGSKVSGLGLGLYISKEIINKHGGSIGVDSEEGKGSEFWFTIPVSTN